MNSRDYWKKRSLNLEELLHTRAEQTVTKIGGLYEKAQENICGQIEHVFSSYVHKGGAMNEKKAAELLTVKETQEARDALLEQYQAATGQVKRDIWARLSAPAYANRISRLQALRDDIYSQARRVGLDEVELVRDRLTDTLEQSYYRTTFDVQQYTGEGYRFDLLGDDQITAALAADWSGENWSDRLWDNNQRFADAVEQTVTVGLMAGLRYDEMRDNLLAVIGLDDTQGARYNARRLVMTECSYIANQGHLMGYQGAEIECYIYLATLDLRTSEICRKLDGQRFPVAEAQAGTNLPPMHPHCRSTTMPDMDEGQLNRVNRAARDPVTGKSVTIPGYMTYKEWYAKYVDGKEQPNNGPEDVLEEYLSTATPGKGTVTYDEGYNKKLHTAETQTAQWIHNNLGGDIHLLNESRKYKVMTPDYLWREKLWDLKSASSAKAANSAVRHGLKQIQGNPGGIILNYGEEMVSLVELEEVLNKRMTASATQTVDILVLRRDTLVMALRYKK
ncbi:MAG: minor capsid protein [Clostridiales bacterium]|nr:minor capsid protein [Clostridiales bacterium]